MTPKISSKSGEAAPLLIALLIKARFENLPPVPLGCLHAMKASAPLKTLKAPDSFRVQPRR